MKNHDLSGYWLTIAFVFDYAKFDQHEDIFDKIKPLITDTYNMKSEKNNELNKRTFIKIDYSSFHRLTKLSKMLYSHQMDVMSI